MSVSGKRKRRPRGTGFVRQRGNSRLLVITVDGRQYTRAVKTATKREAEAKLSGFIAEVRSGAVDAEREAVAKAKTAPTFSEAAADFMAFHVSKNADAAETRWAYENALARVAAEIGDRRISEIDDELLHRTLRKLHEDGRAVGTMRLVHSVVGRLFRNATKRGLIAVDPTPKFSDLQLGTAQPRKRDALTADQIAALLRACGDDGDLRLWVQVMLGTGARPGEALAIRWQDVDFIKATMTIEHSVKRWNDRAGAFRQYEDAASSCRAHRPDAEGRARNLLP